MAIRDLLPVNSPTILQRNVSPEKCVKVVMAGEWADRSSSYPIIKTRIRVCRCNNAFLRWFERSKLADKPASSLIIAFFWSADSCFCIQADSRFIPFMYSVSIKSFPWYVYVLRTLGTGMDVDWAMNCRASSSASWQGPLDDSGFSYPDYAWT